MKRAVSAAVSVLLALGMVAVVVWGARRAPEPVAAGPIRWQTDLDAALVQAAAQHRIVMVDFYADG